MNPSIKHISDDVFYFLIWGDNGSFSAFEDNLIDNRTIF